MTGLFQSVFAFFLTWWGAALIGALDASIIFFLPFGVDAVVIYLAARRSDVFWWYPVMAAAGSVAGAAVTYWVGHKIGEFGLARHVDARRLERLRRRVRNSGAVALAVPALMPPPFPLTPFILTCGALEVNRWQFLAIFGGMRLLRFGLEALLATLYGTRIVRVMESDTFQLVVGAFILVAIAGTLTSGLLLWRSTRQSRRASA